MIKLPQQAGKKIFAFDLDGTLLKSDKSMSNRALNTINQLANQGHLIIIATARPPRDVARLVPAALLCHYLICYNGAQIFKGTSKIFDQSIQADLAYKLIGQLANYHSTLFIGVESQDTFHVNQSPQSLFGEVTHSLTAFTNSNHSIFQEGITKIICGGEADVLESLPIGPWTDLCSVTHTDNGLLIQIMAHGVSKWVALERIASEEGVAIENIVAFGDDHNDLAMLTFCGVGIAMANATHSLLEIAQYVTKSNDEDGVALFLEANYLETNID